MKKLILSILLIAGLVPAIVVSGPDAFAQLRERNVPPSAVGEILRRGNMVEHVGGDLRYADQHTITAAAIADVFGQPADDSHKWFITIVTQRGCAPCARLKADLASDPHLQALVNTADHKKSWAHLNVYDINDKSQQHRWKNIRITSLPTIIVQPPRSKQYGEPSTVVFQVAGYDGNAKQLFERITGGIRAYVAKVTVPKEGTFQQAAYIEPIGVDPPWQPVPKVDPVAPSPAPVMPQVFPFDPLAPNQTPDAAPSQAKIPEYAQVVIVEDAKARDESCSELTKFARRLKKSRNGDLKIIHLDWEEASKQFPISRDEVPLALVTDKGKIESKVLSRLLDAIAPEKPAEVKPAEVPSVKKEPTPAPQETVIEARILDRLSEVLDRLSNLPAINPETAPPDATGPPADAPQTEQMPLPPVNDFLTLLSGQFSVTAIVSIAAWGLAMVAWFRARRKAAAK